jgi:ABC-2 type transport system ATP-binding protein
VANDSVAHLRNLMELPSLEDIFSQLAVEQDSDGIAREIVAAIEA